MMFVSINSNTAGVNGGEGTAKLSEAHEFTSGFSGACVCQSLVFVCRFVLFMLCVCDLRQVCGFLRVLRSPPPIKLTATI